jgi:hypothetical protein
MSLSLRILHICTEKEASATVERLMELAGFLEGKVEEQLLVCAEASVLQLFCNENDLTNFPVTLGFLSQFSNAALVKRICENYGINLVHMHDTKALSIAAMAFNERSGIAYVSNISQSSGRRTKKLLERAGLMEEGSSAEQVLALYEQLVS